MMTSSGLLSQSLFPATRDFLLNKEGAPVKADAISGKVVGIIMAPHWLPATLEHTISLIEAPYKELLNRAFVLIYVAVERDEEYIDTKRMYGETSQVDERTDHECFADSLKKLPDGCLVVPFEDVEARINITEKHNAGIASLAFFGVDGQLISEQGLALLEKWGAEGYPFDSNRFLELRKVRGQNQTLQGLLVHGGRDNLISAEDGKMCKVADIEGKTVALYFSAHWCSPCNKFTSVLTSIYNELKERGEDFEVVFVSADDNHTSFREYLGKMPWLAVPYENDKTRKHLDDWFEVQGLPTLIVLNKQGKTLNTEGAELIYRYGLEAYPFTADRVEELKQEEEAKRASQTLESLLVTDKRDFVLSKLDPVKVVSLVGKTVGLYFSAHWCPPCRKFTPMLESVYDELKGRGEEFEVIFMTGDRDEESFSEYYKSMPWLAMPFDDKALTSLAEYFDIERIPQLVIIGPGGKTVTTDGQGIIGLFGAEAFPFTDDRIVEVKALIHRKYKNFPKEVTCEKHDHTLTLTESAHQMQIYVCDDCNEQGYGWLYQCAECGFDLHPHCIGEVQNKSVEKGHTGGGEGAQGGYICEGDVCRKV
ncbi:hypothetical protein L7F22_041958 [Adiantum nelumboides]|nr:hypothetical protein [Adiantum nelumboides]